MTATRKTLFWLCLAMLLPMAGTAASGGGQMIPLPGGGDAIVVPKDSPVRFESWTREDITANFSGRFQLKGRYQYQGGDQLYLVPDPETVRRLPHWRDHGAPTLIFIDKSEGFVKAIIPPSALARLQHHRIRNVNGRITILADHFKASIDCDEASYTADFVSVGGPLQLSLNEKKLGTEC
jgi:hypothetical protein